MTSDSAWWFSMMLGAGIGVLYGVASYITAHRAVQHEGRRFLIVFFGGMGARLFVTVLLVTLVLVLVEVQVLAFVGAFLALFGVGLGLEVWMVHRGRIASSGVAAGPPAPERDHHREDT